MALRHPEYGGKHACVACATRFYDLTRKPAVCPKCGTAQPALPIRTVAPRRGAEQRAAYKAPVPALAEADEAADVVRNDEDEDEDDEAPDEAEDVDAAGAEEEEQFRN